MKIILNMKLVILFTVFILIASCESFNKYSEDANKDWKKTKESSEEKQDKPFRMMKINELWEKAQKRLSGQKLKNLKTDLKQQDKDELLLKQLKSSGQDKEGLKEAQIRKNLQMIINKYGLSDAFGSEVKIDQEKRHEKQLFKDKKLDKLWKKAEMSGFSDEELKMLKEEFNHHQNKVDEYLQLMSIIDAKDGKKEFSKEYLENSIEPIPEPADKESKNKKGEDKHQALKEKHKELKSSYHSLKNKVVSNKNFTDFEEENVQKLWNMAKKSDFTSEELESLKEELVHYQHRVKKLKYFEEQLNNERMMGKHMDKDTTHETKHLKSKVKELTQKTDKLHRHLETKILQRHIEL